MALLVGSPLPPSQAVLDGLSADSPSGQVRIFEDGYPLGGGTLVDRNWVLTAAHLFRNADIPAFSLRFGVTTSSGDSADTTHARVIDRIAPHPSGADVALVHFADPVPAGTWIPSLAAEAPRQFTVGRQYGWAPRWRQLKRALGVIIDPTATANAEYLRNENSLFSENFPPGIDPLVVNVMAILGDSGSGLLSREGALLGVHSARSGYRYSNSSGNLQEHYSLASFQQPVWVLRDWIQQVTSGEGPSNSKPPEEELKKRRLLEEPDGDLPMTLPPQTVVCDPGEASCTTPDPTWTVGNLTGAGNYRGTALAVCAQATGNNCSLDGTAYAGGAIGRLPLGTSQAPGTVPRQVMVWCRTSDVFTSGAPAQPALRVSFTNNDGATVPLGYGWWDVTPDQVGAGSGRTPVDTSQFATC
jgi:hypothetical protein